MKITWALMAVLGVTAMMTVGGCAQPEDKPDVAMNVATEDGSVFPAALAGEWKSDRHGWQFVIEPDGRISAAVISLGRVRIAPGETASVPTISGAPAVFTPGPWTAHYDPTARMLTIKIAMSHIRVPMAQSVLEGSSADVFTGDVSPTMDVWQAQWTAFTDYTARTGESKPIDLSTDKTYGETQPLVFTKTTN